MSLNFSEIACLVKFPFAGGKFEFWGFIIKISPKMKQKIKSIVVPEFKGGDHLPISIDLLRDY